MRESKIEKYLKQQVKLRGGGTRKWVSPGRVGVPDQIIIWPDSVREYNTSCVMPGAAIHFVELKATGKNVHKESAQAREHVRLQKLGCVVVMLNSIEAIDNYLRNR